MKIIDKLLIKFHIKKPPENHENDNNGAIKLPPPVLERLKEEKLDTDNLIFFFKSDMNDEALYSDTYIMFDEKGLYIADFLEEVRAKKKSRKKLEFKPTLSKLTTIPINEIDEICIEKCIATGRLTYKFNGEYFALGCFSIGLLSQAECFTKVFNNFKANKDYQMYIDSMKKSVCKKCGKPVPPGRVFCKKCTGKSSTVKRLFSFFKEVRGKMIFFIASILISTGISLIIPQFSTQKLYDEVLNPGNTLGYEELLSALLTLVGTIAGLKIIHWVFTFVYQYIIAGMLPWVVYSIKLKIFTAMQKLSVGFYTHKQTGSLMERVTRDSNNIYWFFVDGFPYVITNAITVIGIFAIMFATSWKLTVILLISALGIVVAYPLCERIFRKLHHKVWVQNSNLTSKVSDNINGHRIIKAFSKEDEEYEHFHNISSRLMNAEIKSSNAEATVFPLLSVIVYSLSAVVLGYGGVLAVKYNEITIGELLSFVVYLQMLQSPIEFLSWVTNWWARCVDSAQRVFEIMDTEPDIKESENPIEIKDFKGEIELNELQFEYEPAQPIIKNLSLKINAGEMLGIVGKTGAGKTTISNLIARLYDPKEGSVKIDGIDVKDIPMKQLKENIGIVSQDIFLFMGTIADNIRYAKPDATNEEVIAAAKAASAHSFISKLPDGYETFVGSGGQDLSGGERQRVSIARTIIQNPKILILDEATAAMDTETERNIQNSLAELKSGRTTISIAHRLSTLRDADKLAVIDDGECIEFGTYKELMEKQGEYYRLFKLQEEALKFIGIGENNNEDKENDDGNN
ncbi:MAG: ATP-binding cassette domain-containing protein [Ruminococcaceae bacterium]|nr:ATP-binding cassette domain-containing protein [Oscillospiraceae bacterium]